MRSYLGNAEAVRQLAQKLQQYKCVSKFDDDESEADRLAHSLSDLERAFSEILTSLLPELLRAEGDEQVHNALLDIGEELRHILYHINDPEFFSYLKDDQA